MKNKYVKSMMGLMLSVSLIAGGTIGVYASDTTETATESTTEAGSEADSEAASEAADAKEDAAEEDAVYGEVKSVDDDTITFTVGTRNEAPADEKQNGEVPEKPDGEAPQDEKTEGQEPGSESFLTLTSEEREVTVSADTEIVKGMIFDGEKPDGETPDGEKPMSEEADQKDAEAAPEAETLTIDDIKAGDIIKVTYDKDNNVTRIEIMSTPEEKPDSAVKKAAEQEEDSEEETTEA